MFTIRVSIDLPKSKFIVMAHTQIRKNVRRRPVLLTLGDKPTGGKVKARLTPAVNMDETEKEYIITVAIPGFERKDFLISIDKDTIYIEASKDIQHGTFMHDRCEYDYSCWKRIFQLPDDADALMTSAAYNSGELTIRVPKGNTDDLNFSIPIIVY
jgi:HSP20 family molecular chaperone IbpA